LWSVSETVCVPYLSKAHQNIRIVTATEALRIIAAA